MKIIKKVVVLLLAVTSLSFATIFEDAIQDVSEQAAQGAKEVKAQVEASRAAAAKSKSGGWKKIEKNVGYLSLFGYKLKNDVSMTFEIGSIFGSPDVTYFKKLFFGRYRVSSGFWLSPGFRFDQGCFADVAGDGQNISSFVLKTVVPDFVSKSLGYGNREVQLVASTKITPPEASRIDGTADSEIQILDKDGQLIETLHDKTEAYPALIGSYKDFTGKKNTQCK